MECCRFRGQCLDWKVDSLSTQTDRPSLGDTTFEDHVGEYQNIHTCNKSASGEREIYVLCDLQDVADRGDYLPKDSELTAYQFMRISQPVFQ